MLKDESGNKYGMLAVLGVDTSRAGNGAYWICKCDCGQTTSVWGANLRNGHTKSCGCLRETDITGKRYGRLVAIKKTKRGASGDWYWLCRCDCGGFAEVLRVSLTGGTTIGCGCMKAVSNKRRRKKSADIFVTQLFSSYQSKSRERKIDFLLSFDDFKALIQKPCHWCGAEPGYRSSRFNRGERSSVGMIAHGIDRIDSNGGYTYDNVVSCCKQCNWAKLNWDADVFVSWILRAAKHIRINKIRRKDEQAKIP